MRDYYEVLGVPRDASKTDLKRAYRRLAMKYHPDQNKDDPDAEERFKEAAEAYSVLTDDDKRPIYDRYGIDGLRQQSSGPGFADMEDIFSSFGDIFGDFLGNRRRREARGNDLRVDLRLSFAEAVWGTTKEIDIARNETCETCDGSGAKAGTKPDPCSVCEGKGQVLHSQGFFMIQTTCPSCRGEGVIIRDKCSDCRGRGTQRARSTLTVQVPPGVDNGQTLRLAGKGELPPSGSGRPGNLFVVLRVDHDKRFVREDENILSEVPISYLKAALGGSVTVPTLDDNCEGSAEVEVKAGTQPGDVSIRRGEGIPRVSGRGRGDHVVRFQVKIPTKLSRRERELLEELAEEVGEEHDEKDDGGVLGSLFGRKKK